MASLSHSSEDAWADPPVTEHGGRVELRLQSPASAAEALYSARFFEGASDKTEPRRVELKVTRDGQVSPISAGDPPSPWLLDFAQAVLKIAARNLGTQGWPRRLTRWRKAPND